jgi:hypothetical protein
MVALSKVDMKKYDESDPSSYPNGTLFSLHGINDDLQKLNVGVFYLDVEHWKWYKRAYKCYIA